MRHRPLQNILQTDRLLWHIAIEFVQCLEMMFKVKLQISTQQGDIAATCAQNLLSLVIKQHRIEDMLCGQKLMVSTLGLTYSERKRYLYFLVEHTACYSMYLKSCGLIVNILTEIMPVQ